MNTQTLPSYGANLDCGVRVPLEIVAAGHALGSRVVPTASVERRLGLERGQLAQNTGIEATHQCGRGEDVVQLGERALRAVLADADLRPSAFDGRSTVLLYLIGGIGSTVSPSPGVEIARRVGLEARVKTIDCACAAPVAALEDAACLLHARRAQNVFVLAASDLDVFVGPQDCQAGGLFGAGAGGLLVRGAKDAMKGMLSCDWLTLPDTQVGSIAVRAVHRNDGEVTRVDLAPFAMRGTRLALRLLELVPPLVEGVLAEAGWRAVDVDRWIFHQPAPRLLELLAQRLAIDPERVAMPSRRTGNLGPASALCAYSIQRAAERSYRTDCKTVFVTFGFGLSVGAIALQE